MLSCPRHSHSFSGACRAHAPPAACSAAEPVEPRRRRARRAARPRSARCTRAGLRAARRQRAGAPAGAGAELGRAGIDVIATTMTAAARRLAARPGRSTRARRERSAQQVHRRLRRAPSGATPARGRRGRRRRAGAASSRARRAWPRARPTMPLASKPPLARRADQRGAAARLAARAARTRRRTWNATLGARCSALAATFRRRRPALERPRSRRTSGCYEPAARTARLRGSPRVPPLVARRRPGARRVGGAAALRRRFAEPRAGLANGVLRGRRRASPARDGALARARQQARCDSETARALYGSRPVRHPSPCGPPSCATWRRLAARFSSRCRSSASPAHAPRRPIAARARSSVSTRPPRGHAAGLASATTASMSPSRGAAAPARMAPCAKGGMRTPRALRRAPSRTACRRCRFFDISMSGRLRPRFEALLGRGRHAFRPARRGSGRRRGRRPTVLPCLAQRWAASWTPKYRCLRRRRPSLTRHALSAGRPRCREALPRGQKHLERFCSGRRFSAGARGVRMLSPRSSRHARLELRETASTPTPHPAARRSRGRRARGRSVERRRIRAQLDGVGKNLLLRRGPAMRVAGAKAVTVATHSARIIARSCARGEMRAA